MSIFINYRKDDSRWNTQALYNGLLKYFPKESIFKDFNNIQPGEDFVESINSALGQCSVLLVVISKDWLNTTNADGKNRLDDPNDFVRIEIATALKRKIRVIPVLFDNIEMPRPETLPEELHPLTRRQFISISDTRFDTDLQKLTEAIKRKDTERATLQSILQDAEPDSKTKESTTEISLRTRAIVATIAWLIAAMFPLFLLIISPVNENKYFERNETIMASLGVNGLSWAVIGAVAGTNRKKWAIAIILLILGLVPVIIALVVNKENFEAMYATIALSLAAIVSLLIMFFVWLFKKIAN